MAMEIKTYVAMRVDPKTLDPHGPPLAVKLTHYAAHQVAKEHAPAKVFGPFVADKNPQAPEGADYGYQDTESRKH